MTAYATLVFGRHTYDAFTVVDENGARTYLSKAQAQEHYEKEFVAAQRAEHEGLAEEGRLKREAYIRRAVVNTGVEVRRDTGGRRPTKVRVDTVVIDGVSTEVSLGGGSAHVQAQARLRWPDTAFAAKPFEDWWRANKNERRTWRAELITASDRTPIELGAGFSWDWGFPVQEALAQLDTLSEEGWRLVHVSEDHGLYKGEDATNEAFLARVRYLLER